jgi:predicted dehydrogenase
MKTKEEKTWRVGLIGCGWAGEQHVKAIRSLKTRAILVAIADTNEDLLHARVRDWKPSFFTTDYMQVLNRKDIDAVIICLPHDLHAPVGIQAVEAGLHVLVEKPLASTLEDADALITAADRAGVTLMVAENVRFESLYQKVASLLRENALGDIFLLRIAREHQMHDYLRARPWFLQQQSGGIMFSGGVHDFELVRMLAGDIESVYASSAPKALPDMIADDTSVALVKLKTGATAVIVESFSIRTAYPGVHGSVHGSKGSLWFYDNQIEIYTSDQDGQPQVLQKLNLRGQLSEAPHTELNSFYKEVEHFLDCLDTHSIPTTNGKEQREPLLAVLAAYRSMVEDRRVSISEIRSENALTK